MDNEFNFSQAESELLSVDRMIAKSGKYVSGFYRKETGNYWRDTDEITTSEEEDYYYPTATFLCISLLVEGDKKLSSEIYNNFVKQLKVKVTKVRSFEKLIGKSKIGSEPDHPNIYTTSWCVRALAKALPHLSEAKDQDWVKASIAKLCKLMKRHIVRHKGARLPKGKKHPFLLSCVLEAIAIVKKGIKGKTKSLIVNDAISEIDRIISSSVIGSCRSEDVVALAYWAKILQLLESDDSSKIVECAKKIVCEEYSHTGGWALGRSLVYESGGDGVQISRFDIGVVISQLSPDTLGRQDRDETAAKTDALRTLYNLLYESIRYAEVEKGKYSGWCNDHIYNHNVVESWSTAISLRFLVSYRKFLQQRMQSEILKGHQTRWPDERVKILTWEKLKSQSPRNKVLCEIETHYIRPVIESTGIKSETTRRTSMILFGPPGTAKTTISTALAKKLNWPIVTITPSLFLSDGIPRIDHHASRIFSGLRKLENVVILFDECDELFRQRDDGDSTVDGEKKTSDISMAALITGAMLPRIQDLHDVGNVIFIIATNRLLAIDEAIRREGRIDNIFGIGPPDKATRKSIIEKVDLFGDELIPELVSLTENYTIKEVIRVTKIAEAYLAKEIGASVKQVVSHVNKKVSPSIRPDQIDVFLDKVEEFAR